MLNAKPSDYFVGIILFAMVITGGVAMLKIINDDSPGFVDGEKYEKFNRTFNVMNDITQESTDLKSGIEGADTDFGLFGVLNSLISSAWQIVKLLFGSLSFMNVVFGGLYSIFGIPVWVGNALISLVTVMIAFAIFAAIFQREL